MRSFSLRPRTKLIVYILVCSAGVACATRRQEVQATEAAPCTGRRTLVIHNGTQQTLEVVLGSGVSLGQVVDVISPGQRSMSIRPQGSGSMLLRDRTTKRVVDYNDRRVRYEYVCEK